MKVFKKVGGGVPFVRKAPYEYDGTKYDADIKDGDTIKIMDGGNLEQGTYGEQNNFRVKTRNGEKKLAFNQSSINVLFDEFGDDTEAWIGKDVKVILKKGTYAGKRGVATYIVTDGWKLDEYGELVKDGDEPPKEIFEDEINAKDVPF